jgi:hypothetical protein
MKWFHYRSEIPASLSRARFAVSLRAILSEGNWVPNCSPQPYVMCSGGKSGLIDSVRCINIFVFSLGVNTFDRKYSQATSRVNWLSGEKPTFQGQSLSSSSGYWCIWRILTPDNSSHWLVHRHERGTRSGLYMTRTGYLDASVPWRWGHNWSSKLRFFRLLASLHGW